MLDGRRLDEIERIGGIPLPRPDLPQDRLTILKNIEDCWTGVTRKHLEACVAKGFAGHPTSRVPGCILVAVGEQKARTVYQALVCEGLVNHAFIDYACAHGVSVLLRAESTRKPADCYR